MGDFRPQFQVPLTKSEIKSVRFALVAMAARLRELSDATGDHNASEEAAQCERIERALKALVQS